jgi:hypothetical protein
MSNMMRSFMVATLVCFPLLGIGSVVVGLLLIVQSAATSSHEVIYHRTLVDRAILYVPRVTLVNKASVFRFEFTPHQELGPQQRQEFVDFAGIWCGWRADEVYARVPSTPLWYHTFVLALSPSFFLGWMPVASGLPLLLSSVRGSILQSLRRVSSILLFRGRQGRASGFPVELGVDAIRASSGRGTEAETVMKE